MVWCQRSVERERAVRSHYLLTEAYRATALGLLILIVSVSVSGSFCCDNIQYIYERLSSTARILVNLYDINNAWSARDVFIFVLLVHTLPYDSIGYYQKYEIWTLMCVWLSVLLWSLLYSCIVYCILLYSLSYISTNHLAPTGLGLGESGTRMFVLRRTRTLIRHLYERDKCKRPECKWQKQLVCPMRCRSNAVLIFYVLICTVYCSCSVHCTVLVVVDEGVVVREFPTLLYCCARQVVHWMLLVAQCFQCRTSYNLQNTLIDYP